MIYTSHKCTDINKRETPSRLPIAGERGETRAQRSALPRTHAMTPRRLPIADARTTKTRAAFCIAAHRIRTDVQGLGHPQVARTDQNHTHME